GIFVQHPKYLIDGLVRLEDLGNDWWEVDVKQARVRGERSGRSYTLGTRVTVEIGEVNLATRQLTLLTANRSRTEVRGSDSPRARSGREREPVQLTGVHRQKDRKRGHRPEKPAGNRKRNSKQSGHAPRKPKRRGGRRRRR